MSISKPIMGIFIILVFLSQAVNAVQVLAVLEILPKSNVEEQITIDEMRHLTGELRKQATMVLPTDGYAVLTRDNIIALIPSDEKEADCLAESCAVDIGRAIGAEYVTSGSIGKFGKKLSISVELYESMGGKLLGSIVMESEDIEGLLVVIRQEARGLFSKITPKQVQAQATVITPEQKEQSAKAATDDATSKLPKIFSKPSFWVGVALDVIGVGLILYGVTQNHDIENLQKDYDSYGGNNQISDFENIRKDMDDAKSLRNIMYISGGVAIVSGIGVHIWF